ncbi:MAG: MoaD/ThiS family protein, partial [candidate division Zixibacteria bacterium]|nr:MoaD/ThiS family protein [candidate division Zixibacteria bacterium]
TIKLFAVYRDLLGKSEITLVMDGRRTVADLYDQVLGGRAGADLRKATLFAVNETYVPAQTIVQDGDRVAFIPPVSGG